MSLEQLAALALGVMATGVWVVIALNAWWTHKGSDDEPSWRKEL